MKNTRKMSTKTLVLGAILTALVVVLQVMSQYVKFGPFSITLALTPIIIGAATCGPAISSWLGFVMGVVVLLQPDTQSFYAVSVPFTILTVLVKGTACGFVSGLIFVLLEKTNKHLATWFSALICPIVNTGIFVLGCFLFFMPTIQQWAGAGSAIEYLFIGMIGANFLVEMGVNILLSPIVIRILSAVQKIRKA